MSGQMSDFDRWLTTEPEPEDVDWVEIDPKAPEPCIRCGWQGMHADGCDWALEAEVLDLQEEIEMGLRDCAADMGEEVVEAGAWVEIVRNVLAMSEASPAARREILRLHGLEEVVSS